MSAPSKRTLALQHLRRALNSHHAIIGGGAGNGLSAKSQILGAIDLVIVYNSGRFRQAGLGSLAGLMPFGDANQIVKEMGAEVLAVARSTARAQDGSWRETPVLAGVCGTDPFRDMPQFLAELKGMGFTGVQNFPTVGLIDGTFRAHLEQTGLSYSSEVSLIHTAHSLDMLTAPYVFDTEQTAAMVRAGADIVVAHMGLTTSGSIGAQTALELDECVRRVQAIAHRAREVSDEVCGEAPIVLCHGGPIATPDDARYVIEHTTGVHGFFGASSVERLPVETAISQAVREFKGIRLGQ